LSKRAHIRASFLIGGTRSGIEFHDFGHGWVLLLSGRSDVIRPEKGRAALPNR
jgi:hypothetical protein